MKPRIQQFILFINVLFLANQVEAININYTIEGGIEWSDNVRRDETNIKDTMGRLMGNLDVVDESSRHDFNLGLNVEYLNYKDDTFEDETNLNLDLASVWGVVDDAFTWVLDGYYGQQSINAFEVSTPDNQQDTGFLSTGPNLIWRITNLDSFTLSYRYNDFYAERTLADYQSDLVSASLARRLNPQIIVLLNASYEDLSYEEVVNTDFTDERYSLALTGTSPTTQYSFEFGQVRIDFEDGSELENDIKRFNISRQLNRGNSISLLMSETVDNGAQAIDPNTVSTSVVTDLFVNELVQANYEYDRGDFQVMLSYAYSNQDYVTQHELDQRIRRGSLSAAYGRMPNFRYVLDYLHNDIDFYGRPQIDKENTVRISLEKNLMRSLSFIVSLENFVRESRENNIQQPDVEENIVMLIFRHSSRI